VDSNWLASVEHGRAPIQWELARKVAELFDLSFLFLAEGTPPMKMPLPILDYVDTKPREQFTTVWKRWLCDLSQYHDLRSAAAVASQQADLPAWQAAMRAVANCGWRQLCRIEGEQALAEFKARAEVALAEIADDLTGTPKGETSLDWQAVKLDIDPVLTLDRLLERINAATAKRGKKKELARWLGVHPQSVTDWLTKRKEPAGSTTLRLLEWLGRQERRR